MTVKCINYYSYMTVIDFFVLFFIFNTLKTIHSKDRRGKRLQNLDQNLDQNYARILIQAVEVLTLLTFSCRLNDDRYNLNGNISR
ncbi:hypothetical protein C9426_27005 [Serratia sp. S1B]|nr:hypothetical protein C9426_27005 [Serratia sp. S1B]